MDIDAGNELLRRIHRSPSHPASLSAPGGFAALFDVGMLDYAEPVLVSGCDGVGTKLRLAIDTGRHAGIGTDLVAMCVNDILVQGARPLFFLDYYATAKLDVEVAEQVILGIREACERAGCSLVGGETAEMPGMYREGDYDLAGFCVGIVEKKRIIDGAQARPGDALVALGSNGCHANGYSLIRRILSLREEHGNDSVDGVPLMDALLQPTRIYADTIAKVLPDFSVKAMAHITGGGLLENLPRTLPDGVDAELDTRSWDMPELFRWLMRHGNVALDEMRRTFNCGVGMTLCVPEEETAELLACLAKLGEHAWIIGRLVDAAAPSAAPQVRFVGADAAPAPT